MIKTVVELAEKIIKFQNDKIEYFIAYINLLLEIENYDLATEYAEQLVYIWPNNENSWLVMFNTLIKAKNKEKLEEKILEYEKNNFEHSEQISKFISFWR
jgi:tetratricopeptide (TPR) repeat protein